MIRKIIGYIFIVLPAIILFTLVIIKYGWSAFLTIIIGLIVLIAILSLGVYLVEYEK